MTAGFSFFFFFLSWDLTDVEVQLQHLRAKQSMQSARSFVAFSGILQVSIGLGVFLVPSIAIFFSSRMCIVVPEKKKVQIASAWCASRAHETGLSWSRST